MSTIAMLRQLSRRALCGRVVLRITGIVEQHCNVLFKMKTIHLQVRIENDHRPEFLGKIFAVGR